LSGRLPSFDWSELFRTILKCCLAAGCMAVALYFFVHLSSLRLDLDRIGPRAAQLAGGLALGGTVYLGAAALLRVPELSLAARLAKAR
ncbi:MAG: hypothetical protein KGJ86_16340, partial [Chloroflexota bacterium]|nr:hypothetical protein [Chloroflexota bacterium]